MLEKADKTFFPTRLIVGLALLVPTVVGAQIDPSNPSNPVDHVGLWHNQSLDHSIEGMAELGVNPVVLTLASAELGGQFRDSVFGADYPSPPIDESAIALYFHDRQAFVDEARSRFDEEQARFYDQLLEVVGQLTPEMTAKENAAWGKSVRTLEESILGSLGEKRGEVLLAATSVARHSHAYWNHQLSLGSASPWPGFDDPSSVARELPAHIEADIQGAIGGAAVGSMAGGVGAIPGALEGAAWASAISLVWGWFGF